uniref:Uncharacterized protein n=1 Tax=Noccaea caerulescens TaxID=107243 RepID=A0A1J3G9Q8_NOCCA
MLKELFKIRESMRKNRSSLESAQFSEKPCSIQEHSRFLADENELLRFHGTTVVCGLRINGSTSLCTAEKCCVSLIILIGYSAKQENVWGFHSVDERESV